MSHRNCLLASLLCASVLASVAAQPPGAPFLAAPALAPASRPSGVPLLFVKIAGPPGTRVTLYDGGMTRTFASPLVVGLAPGLRYRFGVEGLNPKDEQEVLYGSLLVTDVLRLPPRVRAADLPAPLQLNPADLEQARSGALVSKWLVLEDPNHRASVQLIPGTPAEVENLPGDEPQETADLIGRTLAVIHLGGREPDADELGAQCPGLIVFPEDVSAVPSLNDPRVLPVIPPPKGGEEVLKDGGDSDVPVYFDKTGQLSGVNPTDTAAEYVTYLGQRRVAISNRVCVVAPRYTLVRNLTPLSIAAGVREASRVATAVPTQKLDLRQKNRVKRQVEETELLRRRERPMADIGVQKVGRIRELVALAATQAPLAPHDVSGRLIKQEFAPDRPLVIEKWVSSDVARGGDVLTYTILYKNVGGQPLRDIAIVDSLSSRLEYLAGTAASDRDAVFISQENEVGSLILRWEVKDPLPPGAQGVVKFQAKVR
jgi:uncharacterized repeat protein (TIGR01451 family)